MLHISPSILSADFANLERDCSAALNAGADFLHIDVMDGHFVPNITVGAPVLKSLKAALPGAVYDVHLMISEPLKYIDSFADAGADIITIHLESEGDTERTINEIHRRGLKAGLSLRPATPVEQIFPYLSKLDLVLVMTVEPGFGGQSFMPEQCNKVFALRQKAIDLSRELIIEVDGGIDKYSAQIAVAAGADALVAGSAIFGKHDIDGAIKSIIKACEGEVR